MGIYIQCLTQRKQEHRKVSCVTGLAKREMTGFVDKEKVSTEQTITEISALNQILLSSSITTSSVALLINHLICNGQHQT